MKDKLPAVFLTTFSEPRLPINQQGFLTARRWAAATWGSRCSFMLYSDTMTDDDFHELMSTPLSDTPTDVQNMLRTYHMSKAFARSVRGTIWLLTRDGLMPDPNSVWSIWKFPVITRRGQVDKVMRVEYPSGRETVFWKMADGVRGQPPPPGKI